MGEAGKLGERSPCLLCEGRGIFEVDGEVDDDNGERITWDDRCPRCNGSGVEPDEGGEE